MCYFEDELLANHPVTVKAGDKLNFNSMSVVADLADSCGNSPHLGYLWLRRCHVTTGVRFEATVADVFTDSLVQTEPVGEIVGAVNIFTGQMLTAEDYFKLEPNITELGQVVSLYHFTFNKKKSFLQKLKELFNG